MTRGQDDSWRVHVAPGTQLGRVQQVYAPDMTLNQKEKLEADLKKEIKKLQRYRDQIKAWWARMQRPAHGIALCTEPAGRVARAADAATSRRTSQAVQQRHQGQDGAAEREKGHRARNGALQDL